MIKKVMEQYGRVDILVNNTGGPKAGFFDDLTDDDGFKKLLNYIIIMYLISNHKTVLSKNTISVRVRVCKSQLQVIKYTLLTSIL